MSTTTPTQDGLPEAAEDEAHSTLVPAPPSVELTPIELTGEPPTDKAFRTASGTLIRARLKQIAAQTTAAPTNTAVELAPSGVNLSLTLAVMTPDGQVATDASGALLITEVHEIIWGDPAMSNPNFDPAAHLREVLGQQAYVLETRLARREAVAELLSDWGLGPTAPAAE